jgi:hypothetical protein
VYQLAQSHKIEEQNFAVNTPSTAGITSYSLLNYVQRTEWLVGNGEFKQALQHSQQDHHRRAVYIMMTNGALAREAINSVYTAKKFAKTRILLIALDMEAVSLFNQHGLSHYYFPGFCPDEACVSYGAYGTNQAGLFYSLKLILLAAINRLGYYVVWLDTDVAMYRDNLDDFFAENADVAISLDTTGGPDSVKVSCAVCTLVFTFTSIVYSGKHPTAFIVLDSSQSRRLLEVLRSCRIFYMLVLLV